MESEKKIFFKNIRIEQIKTILIKRRKNSKEKKSSKSGGTSSKSTSRVRFNINDSTYVDYTPYDINANVQLDHES